MIQKINRILIDPYLNKFLFRYQKFKKKFVPLKE